jgi:hypothetical protein
MSFARKSSLLIIFCCAFLAMATSAHAATIYSESANGDISGNRLSPTSRTLGLGSNDVFATSQGGDQEYLTLIVPSGMALRNLFLRSDVPSSFDQTAFISIASGSPFPFDPAFAGSASGSLGWAHFAPFNVGQDLFPTMRSSGLGSSGFGTQLPAGTYSIAIQQLGTSVTYQLDFTTVAVPEPAALVFGLGVAVLALRRRV